MRRLGLFRAALTSWPNYLDDRPARNRAVRDNKLSSPTSGESSLQESRIRSKNGRRQSHLWRSKANDREGLGRCDCKALGDLLRIQTGNIISSRDEDIIGTRSTKHRQTAIAGDHSCYLTRDDVRRRNSATKLREWDGRQHYSQLRTI